MTADERNKRDALQLLDNLADFQYSREVMIAELRFAFAYSEAEAEQIYCEWCKNVA